MLPTQEKPFQVLSLRVPTDLDTPQSCSFPPPHPLSSHRNACPHQNKGTRVNAAHTHG